MPLFTCSLLRVQHRSSGDKVLNCWFRVSANECAWVELVLGEGFCSFTLQSISASVFCNNKRLFYRMARKKKSHYQRNLFLNKNDKITFLIHPLEIHPAVSLLQPFLFGSFLPMKKSSGCLWYDSYFLQQQHATTDPWQFLLLHSVLHPRRKSSLDSDPSELMTLQKRYDWVLNECHSIPAFLFLEVHYKGQG